MEKEVLNNAKMVRETIGNEIYNRLPKELKSLTDKFNGREKDIVLLSSIGVLSNCIPNVYGIYQEDEVCPHLYIAIIAPPASGKGSMKYSKKLIENIHEEVYRQSRQEYDECMCNSSIENKATCPKVEIKIMPANISSAEVYSYLNSSTHGLLIIENEADTMGQMLKNDWSSYSDILRKGFHSETVSISRKTDKLFEEVKEPKLAIVISGTPDQLKPIIQSKENGLFSRFIIYSFDEPSPWKKASKRNRRRDINPKQIFNELGNKVAELYHKLEDLEEPIEFDFTDEQWDRFDKEFELIYNDTIESSQSFSSNVKRYGLICFRIAMILTTIREMETITDKKILECSNMDFIIALKLTKILLGHSRFIFDSFDENNWLSTQDEKILDDLSNEFERKQAVEMCEKHNIGIRTIDSRLSKWQKMRIIRRVKKGVYKKL
ncbi:MAG: DUF3987 domain-containing protein [Flavobacteriaceae bacterium]|nr:DUF3987 domain-containing protein [Flavobacteriaceae bacterium]